jgi:hypothetical protein
MKKTQYNDKLAFEDLFESLVMPGTSWTPVIYPFKEIQTYNNYHRISFLRQHTY